MNRRRALLAAARHPAAAVLGLALLPGLPKAAALQDAPDPSAQIEHQQAAGSRITLHFAGNFSPVTRAEARRWVARSAAAVASYFGRFPVPTLKLLLHSTDGAGVGAGMTSAEPQPQVRVRVGQDSSGRQFAADWVLVHELVHLAVPQLPRHQRWLHEGIATYVEGVARTRAGLMTAPMFWGELARALPQGLPRDGDRGLDHTPTWGRIYWGGALFCLLADVQIRRASAAALGLQHALQGVLAAGGNYAVAWPLERVLGLADAAVGHSVLLDLYAAMKDRPVRPDLARLWLDLGVSDFAGSGATLLDSAAESALRVAIAA